MAVRHKTSVCLVDDNEAVCLLLTEMLEERGISAVSFTNPVKAIDYLSTTWVNLVISDYYMPEMNGVQFLDKVRQLYPGITVLLMSSVPSVITDNIAGFPVIEKSVGLFENIVEAICTMCG